MVFSLIRSKTKHPEIPNKKIEQPLPPIFIVPGVLGHDLEILNLAEQLDELNGGKRPIYTYRDPRVDGVRESLSLSISDQAKKFIRQIPPVPYQPFPILLVGYSFGCTLITEIACQLKESGYDPHLFLIDAPSPAITQTYFNQRPSNAIDDLLYIINYAAKIAKINEVINLDDELKQALLSSAHHNLIFETIDAVLNLVGSQNNQTLETMDRFKHLAKIAQENLAHLMQYPQPSVPVLDKINLFISNETFNKYQLSETGWEQFAQEVHCVPIKVLANTTHIDLLSESNVYALASTINERFNEEVSKEDILARELSFMLEQYKLTTDPNLNVMDTIRRMGQLTVSRSPQSPNDPDNMDYESTAGFEKKNNLKLTNKNPPRSSSPTHHFGLFPENHGNACKQESYSYNTRSKAKEREQKLLKVRI